MTKAEWYIIGKKQFIKQCQEIIDNYRNLYKSTEKEFSRYWNSESEKLESEFMEKISNMKKRHAAPDEINKLYSEYETRIKNSSEFYRKKSADLEKRLKMNAENEINKLKEAYKKKFIGIVGLTAISLLAISLLIKYINRKRKEARAKMELELDKMQKKMEF